MTTGIDSYYIFIHLLLLSNVFSTLSVCSVVHSTVSYCVAAGAMYTVAVWWRTNPDTTSCSRRLQPVNHLAGKFSPTHIKTSVKTHTTTVHVDTLTS